MQDRLAAVSDGESTASSGCAVGLCDFGRDRIFEVGSVGNAKLTRGRFGEISLALYLIPEEDDPKQRRSILRAVAVKTVVVDFCEEPIASGGEISVLRRLGCHANIVRLLAVYPSGAEYRPNERSSGGFGVSGVSMALEYCPTDLHLSLEWRRRSFLPLVSMCTVRAIAADLFSALEHCHSFGIAHGDVKPGNLLVSSSGIAKLCDFGLAAEWGAAKGSAHEEEGTSTTATKKTTRRPPRGLCTLHYRPPEVLLGGPSVHPAGDVYGAGLVVIELLMGGRPLFPGNSDLDQLDKIFSVLGTPGGEGGRWPGAMDLPDYGKFQFAPRAPRCLSLVVPRAADGDGLLIDLLRGLVTLDPELRMSSAEALRHAWLPQSASIGLPPPSREVLLEELLPPQLDEPVLLESPLNDEGDRQRHEKEYQTAVAAQQVLDVARARRAFLPSLDTWRYEEKGDGS